MSLGIKVRKGNCKKCGKCCLGCEYLADDNTCSVYSNRPLWCVKEFPYSQAELDCRGIFNCGYIFEDK